MTRFGGAIALIAAVIVALIFTDAARQVAHQLGGHDVAAPGDLKTIFHARQSASERQHDHA